MNYFLDTVNVVTVTSIGGKLLNFERDDIISATLVVGLASLIHRVSLDVFTYCYSRYESSKRPSTLTQESQFVNKDEYVKKITPENPYENRIKLPCFVISYLIATKITEVIFKKISEECFMKTLTFLGTVVVLNSFNGK